MSSFPGQNQFGRGSVVGLLQSSLVQFRGRTWTWAEENQGSGLVQVLLGSEPELNLKVCSNSSKDVLICSRGVPRCICSPKYKNSCRRKFLDDRKAKHCHAGTLWHESMLAAQRQVVPIRHECEHPLLMWGDLATHRPDCWDRAWPPPRALLALSLPTQLKEPQLQDLMCEHWAEGEGGHMLKETSWNNVPMGEQVLEALRHCCQVALEGLVHQSIGTA
jgi:hypothetical protein